jgi:two-component system alkaline phosphatase synthesis response regulator PhoP
MTRILVVDDEESIRNVVVAYLQADGYTVLTAEDGLAGLELFRQHPPELVILDIMLPGMDGLKVLRHIREESDVYVLMLTARSEETDRVTGLMMGADDYLTKPFSPLELVARVKAILRRGRSPGREEDVLQFGALRIDIKRHKVWWDEEEIELTALEFQLLKTLADHAGIVLSREQLLQQVWGYDFFGDDRVVDVHIRHIRQKLEADPNNPQIIVTVRGVGYRFEDEVV